MNKKRTAREVREDDALTEAIRLRFGRERHPEQTVDGDDRWGRDPFDAEEE